jgi:hypothetical protein
MGVPLKLRNEKVIVYKSGKFDYIKMKNAQLKNLKKRNDKLEKSPRLIFKENG